MSNEKRYYVYAYFRLDSNSYFYIGKGTGKRMYDTITGRSTHFKNIVNSVDTCVEILYDNLTEYESYEKERETIEDLVFNEGYSIEIKGYERDNENHLVNHTLGGDGTLGYKWLEQAKLKLSKSRTGIKLKEETKEKLSKLNTGSLNPNYGKKWDKEHNKRISEGKKGVVFSEEWKKNLSESHKGQKSKNAKKIRCIELDMTFESGDTAIKEMKKLGYLCSNAKANANGKRPYAGKLPDGTKLHWEWVEEENTPATTERENTTDE